MSGLAELEKRVRNRFHAVHAFSSFFLGRPRGRRVDCRPNRAAMRFTHAGLPKGWPRARHRAKASCSSGLRGWLTHLSQSVGQPRGGFWHVHRDE